MQATDPSRPAAGLQGMEEEASSSQKHYFGCEQEATPEDCSHDDVASDDDSVQVVQSVCMGREHFFVPFYVPLSLLVPNRGVYML